MMIQKYQFGNPLLQADHERRGKIDTWVNQGVKQVGMQARQAEDEVQQFRKADARANRRNKVPMQSNNLAKLQDNLWKMGAFKGIKDRHGKEATYNTAVDGITGRMTRTAIENAKQMGYDVDEQSGTLKRKFIPKQKTASNDSVKTDSVGKEMYNLQAIINHKKTNKVNNPYIVIDKQNGTMSVYRGDSLLAKHEVSLGRNIGDGTTILSKDADSDKTDWSAASGRTPAGIFTIADAAPESPYLGKEPIYRLQYENGTRTGTAIHSPASKSRLDALKKGNKRLSYGCVSPYPGVLKGLYDSKTIQQGDSVYILPETEGNYIYQDNGKLKTHFTANQDSVYTSWKGEKHPIVYNESPDTSLIGRIKSLFK